MRFEPPPKYGSFWELFYTAGLCGFRSSAVSGFVDGDGHSDLMPAT